MRMVTAWLQKLHTRLGRRPARRGTTPARVEQLEDRLVPAGFRPIDEVGNNIANPLYGTANTSLLRLSPAAYRPAPNGNGFNTPSMSGGAPSTSIFRRSADWRRAESSAPDRRSRGRLSAICTTRTPSA